MATKPLAIIAGVGPGTGASIARRFAKSYPVVLLARSPGSYDPVAEEINSSGGQAFGISANVSDAASVKSAFEQISQKFPAASLAAAVFNSGGGFLRKPFLELTEEEFSTGFDSQGKGGFNFVQQVLPLLQKSKGLEHPPTLIFTGATASLKGSAGFSSFSAGKFALRALAQSLAREFGPSGIHVAHVIVDGIIDTPRTRSWGLPKNGDVDSLLSPDAIAESYWHLHTQPQSALSFELDLRPYAEKW